MTNPSPAGFMNRSRLLESDGHNQLAKGRNGYYLYNTNDTYVGRAIEKYGEYGGQEARFLEKLCSAGDIVIEVGANIGAHTVVLAGRVGPSGHVLAFEPQRLAFQTLCANVALNSFTHVDCYWAALGAQRGSIAVPELVYMSAQVWSEQVNVPEMMVVLLICYVAIVGIINQLMQWLEARSRVPGFGQ